MDSANDNLDGKLLGQKVMDEIDSLFPYLYVHGVAPRKLEPFCFIVFPNGCSSHDHCEHGEPKMLLEEWPVGMQ
jgi:hypothetical protein